jgi:hypothetical protein
LHSCEREQEYRKWETYLRNSFAAQSAISSFSFAMSSSVPGIELFELPNCLSGALPVAERKSCTCRNGNGLDDAIVYSCAWLWYMTSRDISRISLAYCRSSALLEMAISD